MVRRGDLRMRPFSARMYTTSVTLLRALGRGELTADGVEERTYPDAADGIEYRASVQDRAVVARDEDGREYTRTVHDVFTATKPGETVDDVFIEADVDDRFAWVDESGGEHLLVVQGHPEPVGYQDVSWKTTCVEVRA